MDTITITRLYDSLTAKIGKETAEILIAYIEGKIEEGLANRNRYSGARANLLLTKEDLLREFERLDAKFTDCKVAILRWIFIFWVSQLTASIALFTLYLRK